MPILTMKKLILTIFLTSGICYSQTYLSAGVYIRISNAVTLIYKL